MVTDLFPDWREHSDVAQATKLEQFQSDWNLARLMGFASAQPILPGRAAADA
jgi:hypothetical protein